MVYNYLKLAQSGNYDKILDYLCFENFKLIRFISNNKYFFQNCTNFEIFLNQASNMNDKFDSCWKLPEKLISALEQANIMDYKLYNKHVKEYQKQIYIACFSQQQNIDNLKMWYMYANNYKGACLVYNVSKLAYVVKVQNLLYETLRKDIRIHLIPIQYSINFGNLLCNTIDENRYSCLFTKSECWKDELEWRLCVTSQNKNNKIIINCMPEKIILGEQISINNEEYIKKYFCDKKLKFKPQILKMDINYSNLNIQFK